MTNRTTDHRQASLSVTVDELRELCACSRCRPRLYGPPHRTAHLPAGPLLRQVYLRGGARATGAQPNSAEEKALERAAIDGWLTLVAADHLAITLLGMTPWELWGRAYDRADAS